jgi:hypothetical protein
MVRCGTTMTMMLNTHHTDSFLPAAALAATEEPYRQKPVLDGSRDGVSTLAARCSP